MRVVSGKVKNLAFPLVIVKEIQERSKIVSDVNKILPVLVYAKFFFVRAYISVNMSSRAVAGITGIAGAAVACWLMVYRRRSKPVAIARDDSQEQPPLKPIHVFFGSQTGTSESLAKDLVEEGTIEFGLQFAAPQSLETIVEYDQLFLSEPSKREGIILVLVLSTYGEGDPSDDAVEFDRYLKEKLVSDEEESFSHVQYTIFGCGNKQYALFNEMAKRTDRALRRLGAIRIAAVGLGDDNSDIEADFREWKQNEMWKPLILATGADYDAVLNNRERASRLRNPLDRCVLDVQIAEKRSKLKFDACVHSSGGDVLSKFFFAANQAPIVSVKNLCPGKTQIDFDISKVPSLRYRSGDTIELLPQNRSSDVNWLLSEYGLGNSGRDLMSVVKKSTCTQLTVKKPFPTPVNLRLAVQTYIDLHGPPSWALVRDLAIAIGHDAYQAEAMATEYKKNPSTSVIKCLRDCFGKSLAKHVSFGDLIQLLPKQKPRAYSICSSQLEDATKISIVVSRVDDEALASTFLCDISKESDLLQVSLRQGTFRLPALPGTPVIMIAVGTGIAPFRAFIVELCLKNRASSAVLFFGCRSESERLYKSEMDLFAANGGTLHVALSREGERQYVQDRVLEKQETLRTLVTDRKAVVYVCGSTKMGLAIMEVFNSHIASVTDLRSHKRYFEELWG